MNDFAELKREGLSIQAISAITDFDRKTMLQSDAIPAYGPRAPAASKLDAFKPYLEERLKAGVWNAAVLLRELKERNDSGSDTILKDWLQAQRPAAQVVAVRRFETPPPAGAGGLGTLGEPRAGRHRAAALELHVHAGLSRMMIAAAALNQKLGTLLRMHEEAFRQLGEVPQEIL